MTIGAYSKQLSTTILIGTVNAVLLVALLAALLTLLHRPAAFSPAAARSVRPPGSAGSAAGTCSAATCGATDPVSDPAYNMREIATQCILLEEHLTVDAKYCVDCIAKHLLHCLGLANEAAMLASSSPDPVRKYPYMLESAAYFQGLMDRWLAQVVDDKRGNAEKREARSALAAELREYRKRLVEFYVIGGAASASAAAGGHG